MTDRLRAAWIGVRSDADDGNLYLSRLQLWLVKIKLLVGCCLPFGKWEPDEDRFEIASFNASEGWHHEWGQEFIWDSVLVRPGWRGWRLVWYENSNL